MTVRKKPLPLKRHEDLQLKELYLQYGYPVDQYAQRVRELNQFVEEWNIRSNRSDSSDDIRHYMLTRRKRGKWVTFDGDYNPLRCPKRGDLQPFQWVALEAAYIEIGLGRDQYAADSELRHRLALLFFQKSKTVVLAETLYAAAMSMQKHWENAWPKLPKSKLGFSDASEVG